MEQQWKEAKEERKKERRKREKEWREVEWSEKYPKESLRESAIGYDELEHESYYT